MQANQRGLRIALAALVLQAGLIVLIVGMWVQTRTAAAWPAIWLMVAPTGLWLVTALLFYCRHLQVLEDEELKELAARGGEAGLFEQEASQRIAANRVRWMERYLVPAFTLLLAGYHVALGYLMLHWIGATKTFPSSAPAWAFFSVGAAFGAFLLSRYTVGMSRAPVWQLLRAPGSYLFADTLTLLGLALVLALEYGGIAPAGRVGAYVLGLLLLVVGVELVLNFVLDLYRPRVPGTEQRFSYDSRLLSILANPAAIGHSIAEALNYQFGFEVSSSWFYRLLQRAFVPLLLAGGVVVWLLSSVVVVPQGQTYVVLHFGEPVRQPLRPRAWPYLTWPWPIDTARRFETGKIHKIELGVGEERKDELIDGKRVYLWAKEHGERRELDTYVAVPPRSGTPATRPADTGEDARTGPNVMIIKLVMNVHYRITDPMRYGYDFTDAGKLLESIAWGQMVQYAASATLDERLPEGAGANRPQGIMSFGRGRAAEDLRGRIAAAVGDVRTAEALGDPELLAAARESPLDLGVEIVRVELIGCHPPKEAAGAFQDVIAAERERDRLRFEAQTDARKMLAQAAGYPDLAWQLAQALEFRNDLDSLLKPLAENVPPEEFTRRADEIIRRARNELERLRKEIHYEQELGRIPRGPATQPDEGGRTATAPARQGRSLVELLQYRQDQHLELLRGVREQASAERIRRQLGAYRTRVRELFRAIGGRAAVELEQAAAYRWQREMAERAVRDTFAIQEDVYRRAPEVYRMGRLLEAMAEGLAGQKKYILAMSKDQIEVWLNLEEQAQVIDVPLEPKK